jgi:hypothetical protein
MNRRYFVFGLSAVLALSLAVPALGGPSSPVATISGSAKKVAKKALRAATAAQDTANQALSTANSANSLANTANNAAKAAQTSANNAQTSADAANANANTRFNDTGTFNGTPTANDGASPKNATGNCPSGQHVTGGGYDIGGTDTDDEAVITESTYGDSWFVIAQEVQGSTPGNWSLTARAICATSG